MCFDIVDHSFVNRNISLNIITNQFSQTREFMNNNVLIVSTAESLHFCFFSFHNQENEKSHISSLNSNLLVWILTFRILYYTDQDG